MRYPFVHGCLVVGLLLLPGVGSLRAQCPVRQPTDLTGALRTSGTYGCAPLRVTTSTSQIGAVNVRYVYEYDKNRPSQVVTSSEHTYEKPGQYFLVQYYEVQNLPVMSCAEVRVYDTIPPRVGLMSCGTQVNLSISDPLAFPVNYDYFLINWGDGQTDTVQADQPRSEHRFVSTDPRRIRVQGIHRFGNCGGMVEQTFVPNQPPVLRSVGRGQPTSDGGETAQISIQNAAGLPLTLQQRVGSGPFGAGQPVPAGAAPTVTVPVDTGQTTCFRIVPGSYCPGYNPSPEVCYTPPAAKPTDGLAFYLPDAFSPNHDGINDAFGPIGTLPSGRYRLIILDRWGRVVFATTDASQAWDGTTDGQVAPAGAYAYRIEVSRPGGGISFRSGRLHLLR